MSGFVPMVEVHRGPFLESLHEGVAVVCNSDGEVVAAWGAPEAVILPRSSCKMLQALPLMESGAADKVGLSPKQLALSCASHRGDPVHTQAVESWLAGLGLGESDLRCGSHVPYSPAARDQLVLDGETPCQLHNNCSGKHAGFLTLNQHLGGHADYVEVDHPVQTACLEAFERMTEQTSPGYGIDGCSAPNFATSITGLARAMGRFAGAEGDSAAGRLRDAMRSHPVMVSGEAGTCTKLMQAMEGRAVVKTGAEGVYIAILPEQNLGIALKIRDGATRASEAAITGLLAKFGVLAADHPTAQRSLGSPILNARGKDTGHVRLAPGFA